MSKTSQWTDQQILVRLETAETALMVARNAAASWEQGRLPVQEIPASHTIGSNAVDAGIAASDVICELALRKHSTSHNHSDAVNLLRTVDPSAADELQELIDAKNMIQYSADPMTIVFAKRLVERARVLYSEAQTRALDRSFAARRHRYPPLR